MAHVHKEKVRLSVDFNFFKSQRLRFAAHLHHTTLLSGFPFWQDMLGFRAKRPPSRVEDGRDDLIRYKGVDDNDWSYDNRHGRINGDDRLPIPTY
jgi:hypothetical protein